MQVSERAVCSQDAGLPVLVGTGYCSCPADLQKKPFLHTLTNLCGPQCCDFVPQRTVASVQR